MGKGWYVGAAMSPVPILKSFTHQKKNTTGYAKDVKVAFKPFNQVGA